jgi:hypothetical protein
MSGSFESLRQIATSKIYGHEADFAGLQDQRTHPLELQLLRVGVIYLENSRRHKLAHSPRPPVEAGAEYDDLRRRCIAESRIDRYGSRHHHLGLLRQVLIADPRTPLLRPRPLSNSFDFGTLLRG